MSTLSWLELSILLTQLVKRNRSVQPKIEIPILCVKRRTNLVEKKSEVNNVNHPIWLGLNSWLIQVYIEIIISYIQDGICPLLDYILTTPTNVSNAINLLIFHWSTWIHTSYFEPWYENKCPN